MKILVAGDGKVGSTLIKQLSLENYDLTLIDLNQKILANAIDRYDIMAITGNCASMDTLCQAGVENADLLIAATSKDEINLLCCLTAHGLNPNIKTIARIRNPEYNDQTHKMKEIFGLSLMVNPDRQTAFEIERILRYPSYLNREYLSKGQFDIIELKIEENSRLNNVKLSNLNRIVKSTVLVCIVMRDGKAFAPSGDFVIQTGDVIYVTGPTDALLVLLKNTGRIANKLKRVVICGGNRVSIYLARLLQKTGIIVQIIEKDAARCRELAEMLPKASIVHGDASSQTLLESEHIDQCDALITMTGLDELNMVISLYGRTNHIDTVVTSIGHLSDSPVIKNLDLGNIVSPKEICSNIIVDYVRAMYNQEGAALSVHPIADGQAEAMEFVVDEHTPYCGVPLKNIPLRKGILLAGIYHEEYQGKIHYAEIPNGQSFYQKGDVLIVVASTSDTIYQLNSIFEKE